MGNVPDHISDAELAEYFCDVGEVLTVQIRGNDGGHYAFVEFALPKQVEQVLYLATQQPFMLEDVMLRVQPRHGKSGQQVTHPYHCFAQCKGCHGYFPACEFLQR